MISKYKAIRVKGKKVDEHRFIFEKHLGRKLTKEEVVHHIDGDKSNNKLANLMLFPNKSAHTKWHIINGQTELQGGNNKKKIVDGKLNCCKCNELKEIKKFVTNTSSHLGVKGICKDCYGLQRKERRQRLKNKLE